MKTIQIKEAQKVFRKHYFKMCGHDFDRILADVSSKLNTKELISFSKLDRNLREKYGDYETVVEVLKDKIKVTLLEEFD